MKLNECAGSHSHQASGTFCFCFETLLSLGWLGSKAEFQREHGAPVYISHTHFTSKKSPEADELLGGLGYQCAACPHPLNAGRRETAGCDRDTSYSAKKGMVN